MRVFAVVMVLALQACTPMIVHTNLNHDANLQDNDSDGVINQRDECEQSDSRYRVDSLGCTLYQRSVQHYLLDINFEHGSGYLHPRYYPAIKSLAQVMTDKPTVNVNIEGHASNQGTNPDVNYKLSLRRARVVANILISKYAIDSSRVTVIGRGAMELKAVGDNSVSHQQNRRVNAILNDKSPLEKPKWY